MDLLASEYGWSFGVVLNETYPEDFFLLQRQIRMRKIDEYLMQSAIIANPHKEPAIASKFIEDLLSQRRFMHGEPDVPLELDVEAFEQLRSQAKKESLLVKTK